MAEPFPSIFGGLNQGIQTGVGIAQIGNDIAMKKQAMDMEKQKVDEEKKMGRFKQAIELLSMKNAPKAWKQQIYSQVVLPSAKEMYGFDMAPNFPENGSDIASRARDGLKLFGEGKMGKNDFRQYLAGLLSESTEKEEQDVIKGVGEMSGATDKPQESPEGSFPVDMEFAKIAMKKAGMNDLAIAQYFQTKGRPTVRDLRAIASGGVNISFGGPGATAEVDEFGIPK
jgi:hypothetical protein